jgi:hypothetical protein
MVSSKAVVVFLALAIILGAEAQDTGEYHLPSFEKSKIPLYIIFT